jgi:predicted transcriptional regulator
MTTVNVSLSDEGRERLDALAANAGVSPEQFLSRCVEQLLSKNDEQFVDIARYVMTKNAELYRRLA